MSTSGTTTYNETRDQIISDALQMIAVLAAGETATTADIAFCSNALNKMVKAWQAQGIHLWTEESGTLFLVKGQSSYNIAVGASYANASDGTNTVETTLTSIGSGTGIQVTSTSLNTATMQIGDTIGIVQDTGIVFWTTITNIAGTAITLNAACGTSSAGNAVYSYTTQLARPLSIQSARLRDNNGFDKKIEIRAREDYMNIPQKQITGDPIILYYSPQLSFGTAYLWPAPSDANKRVELTYIRTIQDFDAGTDQPDLPQEWLECITINLAVRVAPAYGINLSAGGITGNPHILLQAAQYLEDMKAWDTEQPFIQICRKYC